MLPPKPSITNRLTDVDNIAAINNRCVSGIKWVLASAAYYHIMHGSCQLTRHCGKMLIMCWQQTDSFIFTDSPSLPLPSMTGKHAIQSIHIIGPLLTCNWLAHPCHPPWLQHSTNIIPVIISYVSYVWRQATQLQLDSSGKQPLPCHTACSSSHCLLCCHTLAWPIVLHRIDIKSVSFSQLISRSYHSTKK